jgi:hypothetical protein
MQKVEGNQTFLRPELLRVTAEHDADRAYLFAIVAGVLDGGTVLLEERLATDAIAIRCVCPACGFLLGDLREEGFLDGALPDKIQFTICAASRFFIVGLLVSGIPREGGQNAISFGGKGYGSEATILASPYGSRHRSIAKSHLQVCVCVFSKPAACWLLHGLAILTIGVLAPSTALLVTHSFMLVYR